MENLSMEFWLQIVASVASVSAVYGKISARIQYLENKMDKHNNIVERVYKLEESEKNAHARIDELREDMLR